MKNVAWKLVSESEQVCMLIWTNFDSFAITYLIKVACFKNFIF